MTPAASINGLNDRAANYGTAIPKLPKSSEDSSPYLREVDEKMKLATVCIEEYRRFTDELSRVNTEQNRVMEGTAATIESCTHTINHLRKEVREKDEQRSTLGNLGDKVTLVVVGIFFFLWGIVAAIIERTKFLYRRIRPIGATVSFSGYELPTF